MRFCASIFVLVCTVTYVQCMSKSISTGTITSATHPPKTTTTQPVAVSTTVATAPKNLTNAPTSNPNHSGQQTTVTTSANSSDRGLGNGCQQIVKPFGPMLVGAIVVSIGFL